MEDGFIGSLDSVTPTKPNTDSRTNMTKQKIIKLDKYDERRNIIIKNLPKSYHSKFISSINNAYLEATNTNSVENLEQIIGDWEFTVRVESTPKLKKLFLQSEKRGPSKKSYTIEEVFGK